MTRAKAAVSLAPTNEPCPCEEGLAVAGLAAKRRVHTHCVGITLRWDGPDAVMQG